MADQSVTVHVPAPLYARLAERVRQAHRSVEDELLEVVAAGVSADRVLPADLEAAITSLSVLDDAALWQAGRSHLPFDTGAQM